MTQQYRSATPPASYPQGVVCIIHTMQSRELIKLLEQAGWVRRGVKGSHHIYTHPQRSGHLSMPPPRKDLGIGLTHKLKKQAGLSRSTK
jgi:predicted RNA binding protein YcfA (HicA-like mRNA interferase family)